MQPDWTGPAGEQGPGGCSCSPIIPGGSGCGFSAWAKPTVFTIIAPVVAIMANAKTILFIPFSDFHKYYMEAVVRLSKYLYYRQQYYE